MNKWLPTNKWLAAQGVLATGVAEQGFNHGTDNSFWKLATLWGIQAVVTYLTIDHRLPDETT
jgi:hypothetical protein